MSDLTTAQLKFWYRKIAPRIAGLADPHVIRQPYTPDPNPWLWTGYCESPEAWARNLHRAVDFQRPPRPVARISAPAWYPAPRGKRIPVHHVVWHLFRGPFPQGRQLRLLPRAPATMQLNVNPAHYKISRGYEYEPVTWEELGTIDEMEGLIAEIEGGADLKNLIGIYTDEEIASAQATILARNTR